MGDVIDLTKMSKDEVETWCREDMRKRLAEDAERIRREHSIYEGGEQVVAIADSFFTHEGAEGKPMHKAGDTFTVNHDRHPDSVWLIDRNGKACTELRTNLRTMTPRDEGYVATREQWWRAFREENKLLKSNMDNWRCIAICAIAMLIWTGIANTISQL